MRVIVVYMRKITYRYASEADLLLLQKKYKYDKQMIFYNEIVFNVYYIFSTHFSLQLLII